MTAFPAHLREGDRAADTSAPAVCVIVVNWNSAGHTIECLESVLRLTYESYEVVVVDNGSTDGSIDTIRAWARGNVLVNSRYLTPRHRRPPVHLVEIDGGQASASSVGAVSGSAPDKQILLLRLPDNRGFTGANNVAIQLAIKREAAWVFLLNNDAVIEPDALTELIRVAQAAPNVGMAAPAVLRYYDPAVVDRLGIVLTEGGLPYERQSAADGPMLCPDGCAALYSRGLLEAVESNGQYFDEDFFGYGEDVDLGLRARLQGFDAALAPRAVVYHKIGGSQGGPFSPLSVYLRHRNTIWILVKDYPVELLRKKALFILAGQIGTLLWNMLGPRRRSVLQGKIDGIKGIKRMWRKRSTVRHRSAASLPTNSRVFLPHRRAHRITAAWPAWNRAGGCAQDANE